MSDESPHEDIVTARTVATGLLLAGLPAFAVGKLIRDSRTEPEEEWVDIEIH